jgi:hypothetical protein
LATLALKAGSYVDFSSLGFNEDAASSEAFSAEFADETVTGISRGEGGISEGVPIVWLAVVPSALDSFVLTSIEDAANSSVDFVDISEDVASFEVVKFDCSLDGTVVSNRKTDLALLKLPDSADIGEVDSS